MTEIIPISPRTDIYLNTQRHTDDTPTIADYTPPYATAQDAALTANGNEFSYGRAWIAYANNTGYCPEM